MKKLFELNEKDLEMISGGGIDDIFAGIIGGLPGTCPITLTMEKISNKNCTTPISTIVAMNTTAIISYAALMGIGASAGAGALKIGQVLYNRFKNKKTKQRV